MMKQPTILQINTVANSGSTGKIAEGIGREVIRRGWRSVIAYGRWANDSQSELIRIGTSFGNKEAAIENRILDNQGLASRRATREFIQKIECLKPDVVHLHNIHGYYLNYPQLFTFLKERDIPVVWTFHDCWPMTGHCAYFDYSGCKKWKTGCYDPCPCKGDYPKSILFDRSRRNWVKKSRCFHLINKMTLVAVSDWLAELMKDSMLSNYPVKIIKNGVDISVFTPQLDVDILRQQYGLNKAKILLGVANIWDERKGLRDYVRLAEKLPDNYHIVLIGLNDKQIDGLPLNILGLTRTSSQRELARWYSLADIVLNLSYEETFGMTTIEGFACGTPCIVYDRTASPELAGEGTCLVAKAGDIEDVISKLRMIRKKTKEISYSCRKRAEEQYDQSLCFEEYMKLYEGLLVNVL